MNKFSKNISVAHSPDADDIFMYAAIAFGWASDERLKLSAKADDIESLNLSCLKGVYDVCAISFGLYPHISSDYALLDTATSFGRGYGPKLIVKKDTVLKRNFKVALSGKHTSNALLFSIAYPDARAVYMNFLDIEKAVLSGQVDAGVLIHESILDFSDELRVERELWDIWCELAGTSELPLPLGGMAIRRSLPLNDAVSTQNLLKKAVILARAHKNTLSSMLLERGVLRVDDKNLAKYLELYANDESIELSETQLEALDKFFELGYTHGFYSQKIKTSDYLVPSEYLDIRNS
nr:MqnA/MqnD/SBP family protein [uncultured Campylobacter sp.]